MNSRDLWVTSLKSCIPFPLPSATPPLSSSPIAANLIARVLRTTHSPSPTAIPTTTTIPTTSTTAATTTTITTSNSNTTTSSSPFPNNKSNVLNPEEQEQGDLTDLNYLKRIMEMGSMFLKLSSKPPHRILSERFIRVNFDGRLMEWESKKKKSKWNTIDLASIRDLWIGQESRGFELHGKRPEYEDRAFTLLYRLFNENKTLDLGKW